ncbi:hypothetical protein PHMEG_00020100 [Phytophthora megakarya]|uniref:DUF6570 domain-containing protein n=1 Tax=Phytophthora megakarya TaxID=4795 RepID=A0A225VSK6_9STRA|nr:hypothetical protein PHMEG_00020100 [Phytophthora megakarya]
MKEVVCCVCDCFHSVAKVKSEPLVHRSHLMKSLKLRLKGPPNLDANLRLYYDTSDIDPSFQGLLLSRRGILVGELSTILQICLSCRTSLLDKQRANPPKFAIANGLYMGSLPREFQDSTFIENSMLNMAQPMYFILIVRGGKYASLRPHSYFFRADPAPPAQMLPRNVVSEGIIGVTIVGATTTHQKAATLKAYDVRVSRLREQLKWYRENNHLYTNVKEPAKWEEDVSTMRTRVIVHRSRSNQNGVFGAEVTKEFSTQSDQDGTCVAGEPLNPTATRPTSCDFNIGPQDVEYSQYGDENVNISESNGAFSDIRQIEDLDQATWRHNAPEPAHENVSVEDELCQQTADGLISNFTDVNASQGVQTALNKAKARCCNAVVQHFIGFR